MTEIDGGLVVDRALLYAAKKTGGKGSCCALSDIAGGNLDAYLYFRYGLANESVRYAATVCGGIESGYVFLEHRCEDIPGEPVLVGLFAERKTAALCALMDSICESVTREARKRVPVLQEFESVLAVEIMDHQDPGTRKGLGALIGSLNEPPIQIWPQQ